MNLEQEQCSVCLNNLTDNNFVKFECNHQIHLECFSGILRHEEYPRCPVCRRDLSDFDEISEPAIENITNIVNDTHFGISLGFMGIRVEDKNHVLIIAIFILCVMALKLFY